MWLVNVVRCLMAERRFLLIFGFVYMMSVISIIHKTTTLESELSMTKDGEKTNRRKANFRSNGEEVAASELEQQEVESKNNSGVSLNCNKLPKPRFLKPHMLPLTALHSFPGSGNTWVRVLLSSTTGINTGDIYRDGAFSKVPGFSFRKDDTVVAVKTHHPFWDDNNGPDPSAPEGRYWERAILVVRHPLDATISGYNWFRMKGSHVKAAPLEKYLKSDGTPTKEWNKWAHDQIRNWGRCLRYWINIFKGPKLIIFYEDLKHNLEEQLTTMGDFLGLKLDKRRISCTILSNIQQKFHRKQQVEKRILYNRMMLKETEKVLRNVQQLLAENYTHIKPGFRLPANYATRLIWEDFSMKPNISRERNDDS